MSTLHRRDFLKQSVHVGAALGAADLAFVSALPPLSAQDVQVPRAMVRLNPDIEPLVRLIEESPRDRLLERIAERIRGGTGYQPILAALMLAGVRGIRPRPVGFKFHAVLVVNSAHLAAQNGQDRERWLPLFWALDNFKSSQERNRQEGDWRMPPLADNRVPATRTAAINAFRDAMESWNEDAADRAVAGFARACSINEVYELFWRTAPATSATSATRPSSPPTRIARCKRSAGGTASRSSARWHTPCWSTREAIRPSATPTRIAHGARTCAAPTPSAPIGRRVSHRPMPRRRCSTCCGRAHSARRATRSSPGSTRASAPRRYGMRASCCAGELLMRQPGIVGLHTLTATNALHFGYETSATDSTRRMLLLQAAAFLPMFRRAMTGRGRVGNARVDTLEAAAPDEAQAPRAIDEVFADIGRGNRMAAARKTLSLLNAHPDLTQPLLNRARQFVFTKGHDAHDYKFSSAVLEDFFHVAPAWRNRFLASSMFWLRGSGGPDSPVLQRTRQALARG